MRLQTVGARVRWAREEVGISARALDRRAGLTPGHCSLIESERRAHPGAVTLTKIARVLGVSVEWLAMGNGARPTPTLRAA